MNELLVNQDCGVGVKGQDRHDVKHSISQVKGLAGRFRGRKRQRQLRQGLIVGVFSIVMLGMQNTGI